MKKTGYPLEIEISSILNEYNWFVFDQDYYLDEERNEERTIDMSAEYLGTFVEGGVSTYRPFTLSTYMVIECKKSSTHAWVFFTIPETYRFTWFNGQTFEFLDLFTDVKYSVVRELLPFSQELFKKGFLHYDKFQRVAITYHEIQLEKEKARKKNRSEIFEARNQIVKCISYYTNELREHIKIDSSFRPIFFYFPVMVFDGKIYECIVEKEKPKLIERNHMLLRTYHRPKYQKSPLNYGIDIVKREYFRTFLKDIETDIQRLEEQLIEKKDGILKSVDELFSKLQQQAKKA